MVNSQAPGLPPAPRSCAGCGGRISDRFLLFSMERYWHTRCLRCSCCQAQLGDIGPSCYSKGGMILCRSDYIRLEKDGTPSPSVGHLPSSSLSPQAVWTQRRLQRLQPVHPSQRNGDEGPRKRLPPEGKISQRCAAPGWALTDAPLLLSVFQLCHL